MDQIDKPQKELVRIWLAQRQSAHSPLPDRALIRRALGWELAEKTREIGGRNSA